MSATRNYRYRFVRVATDPRTGAAYLPGQTMGRWDVPRQQRLAWQQDGTIVRDGVVGDEVVTMADDTATVTIDTSED